MPLLKIATLLLLSLLLSAATPAEHFPTNSDLGCATWNSRSFNGCEHEVRVDNGCYNRVHFRITVADGRYWDYYVNPGAWMTVPVGYCGRWYFRWL